MTPSHIAGRLCHWVSAPAAPLDARSAPRLACPFLGAVLAGGRRTATGWVRAAGLSAEFRPCYATVAAAGQRADRIAVRLVRGVLKPLPTGAPVGVGAGRHAAAASRAARPGGRGSPQPDTGPGRGPFVYGPAWVVLGLLVAHPPWGVIALPPLPSLYVRQKDLAAIGKKRRPESRAKLESAVELVVVGKRRGFSRGVDAVRLLE